MNGNASKRNRPHLQKSRYKTSNIAGNFPTDSENFRWGDCAPCFTSASVSNCLLGQGSLTGKLADLRVVPALPDWLTGGAYQVHLEPVHVFSMFKKQIRYIPLHIVCKITGRGGPTEPTSRAQIHTEPATNRTTRSTFALPVFLFIILPASCRRSYISEAKKVDIVQFL
jgi:hypothetical protein